MKGWLEPSLCLGGGLGWGWFQPPPFCSLGLVRPPPNRLRGCSSHPFFFLFFFSIFFNFFFFFKKVFIIFSFLKFLIEYMTRGKGIIGIFRQNGHFWHSLVVWGIILVHLVVQGTTLKTIGSLRFFFFFVYCNYPKYKHNKNYRKIFPCIM
jgi:hypothetical protein